MLLIQGGGASKTSDLPLSNRKLLLVEHLLNARQGVTCLQAVLLSRTACRLWSQTVQVLILALPFTSLGL